MTVAAIPVPKHEAREFGVIESDADGRIIAFHEKVAEPPTMPGDDTALPRVDGQLRVRHARRSSTS